MDIALRTTSSYPPSVNFHLWEPCNMRCRFCFATFQDVKQTVLPKGHLPREQALSVVEKLADAGFQKITFAGGEPTLCPWLGDLILRAKEHGLTTMLVTNGSRLLSPGLLETLASTLDWVVLSMDSANPRTHERLGRSIAGQQGRALPVEHYQSIATALHAHSIRLKINTVVSAENEGEDMGALLLVLRPERWKVLQVLPVNGQNDGRVEPLLIDELTFRRFVARHQRLAESGIQLIAEDNEAMTGSYAMVDPAGRFFDNTASTHCYSRPILDVGVANAWQDIRFDPDRFDKRGGHYDWSEPPTHPLVQLQRMR